MLSFFNDLDVASEAVAVAAAQYFATKGFFADYDARLDEPLTEGVKLAWRNGLAQLQNRTLKPMELVKAVHDAEGAQSPATAETRGEALIEMWRAIEK